MRRIGSLLLVGMLAAGCGGDESGVDAILPTAPVTDEGGESAEDGGEAAEDGGEAAEDGGESPAEGGEGTSEEGGESSEVVTQEGGEAASEEGGAEEGGEAGEEGGEAGEEGGSTLVPVEDCTNGLDEDVDGLIDCEDPDCADTEACPGGGPVEGGGGGGGGEPCPEGLTFEGCCSGTVLAWCENDVLETIACQTGCGVWNAEQGFYDCFQDGDTAPVPDPSGTFPVECGFEVEGPPEPPAATCAGSCGSPNPTAAGCYCDELCVEYGDCCEDVCDECGELSHCAGTEEGGEATTEEGGEATTEEGGEAAEMANIVDTAIAAGNFTTLVAAVTAANLADTLADEAASFTVFAPTDDAFAKLPEGTVEGLLEDIDALTNILLYHVVAGAVPAADVVGLTSAATLQGTNVSIEVVDGGVVLNGSVNVTVTDIMCTNGIIHVIDAVLIPAE